MEAAWEFAFGLGKDANSLDIKESARFDFWNLITGNNLRFRHSAELGQAVAVVECMGT